MYWECKDRRKFVDQEIPFTAKYYSKQAQPTRMTEADQHKREDKVKENEYWMFHDLMKRTNANANVDNIVAELKEDSYRETSPQK